MDPELLSEPFQPPPPSSERGENRRIMADAGKMSGAIGFGYFVNLLGGLVVAGILGPVMLGIWKTVQLAVQYTQFANFGIAFGVQKIGPALVSKGRIGRYRTLMSVSLGFSLLLPLVASGALLLIAFFVHSEPVRLALLTLVIVIPVQQFYQHGEMALAIEKRFGAKAKTLSAYTVARVGLSIALAMLLNLSGVLIAYIVTLAWVSARMIHQSRMTPAPVLRLRFSRKLIAMGLPITLIVVGELALTTADKWVVAGALGSKAMGLYNMAIFPFPLLMLLPVSLRQVVNIEVFDKFGHTRDVGAARRVYRQSTLIVALVSPVVIGAVYLGIPWMVNWVLPAYRESIPAIRYHAIFVYSLLLIQTGSGIWIVSGRERGLFFWQLIVAALSSGAAIAAIRTWNVSFTGVLCVHAAGWFLFAFGFLYVIERVFGSGGTAALFRAAGRFLPMALLAVELPLLSRAMVALGFPAFSVGHAVVGGLVHLAVCVPFLVVLQKRTGAVADGLSMIRRRLGWTGRGKGGTP